MVRREVYQRFLIRQDLTDGKIRFTHLPEVGSYDKIYAININRLQRQNCQLLIHAYLPLF